MTFRATRLRLAAAALGSVALTGAAAGTASATTAGPGFAAGPGSVTAAAAGTRSAVGPDSAAQAAPDATVLSGLTARQLAGQRVIYSYPGLTPPASLLALIRDGAAGGVIFFGDNISSHAQIAAVIRTLEAADADPSNPVRAPLLLMTDQEGGQVRRLSGAPVFRRSRSPGRLIPPTRSRPREAGPGRTSKAWG